MEYYTKDEAITKRTDLSRDEIRQLSLPDGRRNALRIIKGGKNDGLLCNPWLLSDLFSVPRSGGAL